MSETSDGVLFFTALIIAILLGIWTYGCVNSYKSAQCFDRTKNENCYEEIKLAPKAQP